MTDCRLGQVALLGNGSAGESQKQSGRIRQVAVKEKDLSVISLLQDHRFI
jgi:hypothetical protein